MQAQTLKVPGATLYYETRGTGPVLLLIAGGGTDAGIFEGIADLLAHDYTAVTYDPRGNSRSKLDGPPEDQHIEVHSEDARRLLDAIDERPAFVLGSSSGATVALDLITRHPTRVARVVIHEAPLLELLPDVEKWRAFHDDVYATYQREGTNAAMHKWAVGVGLDVVMPPPDAPLPAHMVAAMERMASNQDFFFAHLLLPFTRYVPDVPRLAAHKDRIVLAVGQETRDQLAGQLVYQPAAILAEQLNTQVVFFPGDHGGYGAQSTLFVAKLREVLA